MVISSTSGEYVDSPFPSDCFRYKKEYQDKTSFSLCCFSAGESGKVIIGMDKIGLKIPSLVYEFMLLREQMKYPQVMLPKIPSGLKKRVARG